MHIDRTVVEAVLEALESCDPGDYSTGRVIHPSYDEQAVGAAIDAIRAVLAQKDAPREPDGPVQYQYRCEVCGHEQTVRGNRVGGDVYLGSGASFCDECDGLVRRVDQAALAQEDAPDDWQHLKQYGYAPGWYTSKCIHCGGTPLMDKRAICCRTCAEARHAAAQRAQEDAPVCKGCGDAPHPNFPCAEAGALREDAPQPVVDCGNIEAEPVAWGRDRTIDDTDGRPIGWDEPELEWGKWPPEDDSGWWPLYAHPPQPWRRLTQEEIEVAAGYRLPGYSVDAINALIRARLTEMRYG